MDTLGRIHTLACLFGDQGLYDEGVALLREELEGSRVAFGPEHPVTLGLMNQLAAFHLFHGPHGEAEAEAEALDREVLDAKGHGDPEMPLIDPGLVCLEQGLYDEAEMMLEHTLEERRARLGPSHPQTLASAGKLARVYLAQGRHEKAEPLLVEALEEAQVRLGPVHPTTLGIKLSRACNLAALGRIADALRQLQEMQPHILDRLDAELYTNETPGARRHAVASQAGYQDVALSLALLSGAGPAEAELAATAVLRLKGLQIEEEAFLARLARRNPSARERAAEIADLRRHLAALFNVAHKVPRHEGATDERWAEIAALGARLQEREFAFGRVSRDYAQHLQVRHFDLAGLGAFLARPPRRAALLELREYRPYDFRTSMSAPPRWAGLLMTRDRVRVVDLGPVAGTAETAEDLLANPETETETERREVEERAQRAARKLYEQLISPLAAELAELKRLYLAPDGALNLVPFAALLGPDGRRLLEVLDVRLLQTGRDLLRPRPERSAEGLLALGGIDFDADLPASSTTAPGATGPALRGAIAELQRSTEETLPDGFEELPATAEEVRAVAALYRAARPGEPVEVWTGADASEARLKALPRPPRVLHLATHGFYLPRKTPLDRPMLLSGVTLAGANRALREPGQDGILYAIEVQDLDLEGTELVVLSACKTGLGQIDYGEGVSGLVRALRIAGARHVLVTLHEVIDEGAADFMQHFYRCWLGQERFYHRWLGRKHSDPVAAFRAAQLETIAAPPDSPAHRDRTWAQFVMIGA
jgi:CHAT domain-containing protein